MKDYDFIIIGAGVAGCNVSEQLVRSTIGKKILLIDKNKDVAFGASGAAGAFLSPLLGKLNKFKDLVTKSLIYSTKFYKNNFPSFIDNCGTTRIPKNNEDNEKFKEYIPYLDFDFKKDGDGYFFSIGSVVQSYEICKNMINNIKNSIDTRFEYEVKTLSHKNDLWCINDEYTAKNIILTTGADKSLIDEKYIKIRAVWGRRFDILTSTLVNHNYHKECSISKGEKNKENRYKVSIGATHQREFKNLSDIDGSFKELIDKASDIINLDNIEIVSNYVGSRACSIDYFPIVGDIINSKKTIEEFPYLKNGTKVNNDRFTRYKNIFILNGLGGRGFVLAPYIAKILVEYIVSDIEIDDSIKIDRLFKREVKRGNI